MHIYWYTDNVISLFCSLKLKKGDAGSKKRVTFGYLLKRFFSLDYIKLKLGHKYKI